MTNFLAAATIFFSSFLLFQVQPLMGKLMLPWFGGVSSVWTTCMLFFQAMLLAGYWYAHVSVSGLSPKKRFTAHLFLVLLSATLLLSGFGTSWRPSANESPILFILLYLGTTIGLPYLTLSSTAPLLQGIIGKQDSSVKVYRLYALSNFASLLALIAYPALFEPLLALSEQLPLWSWSYALYGLLITLFLFQQTRTTDVVKLNKDETQRDLERVPTLEQARWFLYAAVGCMILLAATNHICQNIASIPFLWILPLGIYLLSFILAFAQVEHYSRNLYIAVFLLSTALLVWLEQAGTPPLASLLTVTSLLVFSACMLCHGELARHKPNPVHLTRYYFVMSSGSIAGSLFVALIAPLIFQYYSEFLLSLLLCVVIILAALFEGRMRAQDSKAAQRILIYGLPLSLILSFAWDNSHPAIDSARNFFGVLHVKEKNKQAPQYHYYRMFHGEVVHGLQFQASTKRSIPTTYYGEKSGIGRILKNIRGETPLRVGGIGLGVGTIAMYGKDGDIFRFYEINPAVVTLAQKHFTFLSDSPAKISHIIGDGRHALAREAPQNFDVLLLDAFSGDSVPIHLLTKEALGEYLRHLRENGVLIFHITNFYLDLVPVIVAAADEYSLISFYVDAPGETLLGQVQSSYLVISRKDSAQRIHKILSDAPRVTLRPESKRLWTDDFSNLLSVIKW